jgi:hypothetical protein
MATASGGGEALVWKEPAVLAPPAPCSARTPKRPSQIVNESSPVLTDGRQHVVVVMERTSTGGTRRQAQFKRAAGGAMSGAERAHKKRVRASLFPQEQAAARARHAKQEQQARPQRERAGIERIKAANAELLATGGFVACDGHFVRVSQQRARREQSSLPTAEPPQGKASPCVHAQLTEEVAEPPKGGKARQLSWARAYAQLEVDEDVWDEGLW